jgi:hypothetical protein
MQGGGRATPRTRQPHQARKHHSNKDAPPIDFDPSMPAQASKSPTRAGLLEGAAEGEGPGRGTRPKA